MPYKLDGPWEKGFAFDVHTVSSTYLGVDAYGHEQWDNTRSEMGQLVYELKYRGDTTRTPIIVNLILEHIRGIHLKDWIVPIPPTRPRAVQPVLEISRELGRRTGIPIAEGLLVKEAGPELKGIEDANDRETLLRQSLKVSRSYNIAGKKLLLIDDLYRSGATLSAATKLLYEHGAGSVAVLTMTKTRSKR